MKPIYLNINIYELQHIMYVIIYWQGQLGVIL